MRLTWAYASWTVSSVQLPGVFRPCRPVSDCCSSVMLVTPTGVLSMSGCALVAEGVGEPAAELVVFLGERAHALIGGV